MSSPFALKYLRPGFQRFSKLFVKLKGQVMSEPQRSLSTENHEILNRILEDRPPGITDDHPLSIEVVSGQGALETRLAAHTRFEFSLATPLFVSNLDLTKFLLSPTQSHRSYPTPFGLLRLKYYVPLVVQAPEAGIPHMPINVLVLENGHHWQNVDLFLGGNFRKKAAEAEAKTRRKDDSERLQVHQEGSAPTLPTGPGHSIAENRLSAEPSIVAPSGDLIEARTPQGFGSSGQPDPPSANVELDPGLNAAFLSPCRLDGCSPSTGRLGRTPLFTVGDQQFSTPPSTLGLDDASRRSRDAASSCSKIHAGPIHAPGSHTEFPVAELCPPELINK
ncbi:hypothetical protein CGMCC3_g7898 [Colletotrichum fructicola]|nr:uncharacterized protein CGMCC3_g7898 [Colletotrichum fructicola]KAE9576300.1 hypothetical protein CGMCC3_g7898 [Colletotrichum fructicola]